MKKLPVRWNLKPISSMIKRLQFIYAAAAVIALVALGGCSAHRNSTSVEPHDVSSVIITGQSAHTIQPGVTTAEALCDIYAAQPRWQSLYMPFSLKINAPMRLSCSGRATMVRGKAILLSMRAFGIEVAQVYIDNDSTWLVDKFHKMICAESTARLSQNFNVDNLQSLIIGHACEPGVDGYLSRKSLGSLKFIVDEDLTLITPSKARNVNWGMLVDTVPAMNEFSLIFPSENSFGLLYSGETETVAGVIPRVISADGQAGRFHIDADLTWTLDKITVDGHTDMRWTPPSGYKRITTEALIEAVKSM